MYFSRKLSYREGEDVGVFRLEKVERTGCFFFIFKVSFWVDVFDLFLWFLDGYLGEVAGR